MTFPEFYIRWHNRTLDEDAAWRAYALDHNVRPYHIKQALKYLGYTYAREHALSQFMQDYRLTNRHEAETMAVAYWRLRKADFGHRAGTTLRVTASRRLAQQPSTLPAPPSVPDDQQP